MKKLSLIPLCLFALLPISVFAEVIAVKPNTNGKLYIETSALSATDYQPLVLCDSEDLKVQVFMSLMKNGRMVTELWYQSGQASSAECHLFYTRDVEDNKIDLELSEPVSIKPGITTFTIRK